MVKQLTEAKATGEDSESIDAVVPAGGAVKKRLADANIQVDPNADDIEDTVKTPQGSNDAGLKEAIDALFGDTELSEDFKTKASVIFEATVNERVNSLVESRFAEKVAELETKLQEEAEEVVESTTNQIGQYIDYVAENWMKKNEVAIEAGYKVTMAESLFSGLVALLKEHNFNLDDDANTVLNVAEEKISDLEEKYNASVKEVLSLKEELENTKKARIFEELASDLVATDADRFKSLTESIYASSADEYKTKITIIKEHYFTNTQIPSKEVEVLEEEASIEESTDKTIDSTIAAYVKVMDKTAKK